MREGGRARAALGVALALALGCSSDGGVLDGGGDEQIIVVSDAAPADGNGTLDNAATELQYYINYGVQALDRLTISGYDGSHTVLHDLEIVWDPVTTEVRLVQHSWAPVGGGTSGATRCATGTADPCPASGVLADVGTRSVIFNGLVLHDYLGLGATSTLTGIAIWEDGFIDGGDH